MLESLLFYSFVSGTAAAPSTLIVRGRRQSVGAKFANRKRHLAEDLAGIVLLNGTALLFGNTVFGGVDQKLCGTNDAHHRENTERYGQITVPDVGGVIKENRRGKRGEHAVRQISLAAATAAFAIADTLGNTASQNHGVNHLYNRPLIGMLYALVTSEASRR